MTSISNKQSLCLSCRHCCEVMAFKFDPDPNGMEFYRARGLKVVHDPDKGETWVIIPCVCPHLTDDGCDVYGKRPYSCQAFDGRVHAASKKECLWGKEKNDEK